MRTALPGKASTLQPKLLSPKVEEDLPSSGEGSSVFAGFLSLLIDFTLPLFAFLLKKY